MLVKDFYLGLDFRNIPTGARLAAGSYLVVKIPEVLERIWDWNDLVNKDKSKPHLFNSYNSFQRSGFPYPPNVGLFLANPHAGCLAEAKAIEIAAIAV